MKKRPGSIFKYSLFFILVAVLAYGVRYAWQAFPIISGYSAKMVCSCVYLSGRTVGSVEAEELGNYPLSLAGVRLNREDSSVTATVFGMAKQKAIFRTGLGCTLINELSEEEVRNQPVKPAWVPAINPDTVAWPMGDLLPDSFPAGIDRQRLHDAVQYAFTEQDQEKKWRTRAVVVLYDGQLVEEKYAPGFDRHTRLLSWSMAKSVTSALVGILVKQGKLDVKSPAAVPAWRSVKDGREQITLENLLQQTSGLAFEENYSKATDATNMLFRKADMGRYTAEHGLKDKPGSVFYYSSGNTNIISGIIRRTVGEDAYQAFPAEALFHKTGMYSAVMEPDAAGNFVGSSYMFASARDWARFGLLYAQDGNWNNERILPEGWVQKSSTPVSVAPKGEYGYQFWLNAGNPAGSANRTFPALPADMIYLSGHESQMVMIFPSRKLVVVRLGQTAGSNWFDTEGFMTRVLAAFP